MMSDKLNLFKTMFRKAELTVMSHVCPVLNKHYLYIMDIANNNKLSSCAGANSERFENEQTKAIFAQASFKFCRQIIPLNKMSGMHSN